LQDRIHHNQPRDNPWFTRGLLSTGAYIFLRQTPVKRKYDVLKKNNDILRPRKAEGLEPSGRGTVFNSGALSI